MMIMIVLALALSVVMGIVLGVLGGGGSILTLPILVHVLGIETKVAIATSLFVVAATSLVGALQHARSGNVNLRTGLAFAGFAMLGAYTGGRVAAWVPGPLLIGGFIFMMMVTGIAMARKRDTKPAGPGRFSLPLVAAEGLAVGMFTGLVGAGGGFLVVPALVLLGGMAMREAIGTSLMIITLKSVAGLAGYLQHVSIDLGIALPITAVAVLGALVGHKLAHRIAPAGLRRGFAGFVILMAIYMLFEELRSADLLNFIGPTTMQWGLAIVVELIALFVLIRVTPRAGASHRLQQEAARS